MHVLRRRPARANAARALNFADTTPTTFPHSERTPLRQTLHFPTLAIFAADELVRFLYVEGEFLRVPFERRVREARGNAAEKDRFGERAGVVEVRLRLVFAKNGV